MPRAEACSNDTLHLLYHNGARAVYDAAPVSAAPNVDFDRNTGGGQLRNGTDDRDGMSEGEPAHHVLRITHMTLPWIMAWCAST